jgi:hypothetical protein
MVNQFVSPVEKITCWIDAISKMKTEVVDHWNGKASVESMDDELPILIYMIVFSNVPTLISELEFL